MIWAFCEFSKSAVKEKFALFVKKPFWCVFIVHKIEFTQNIGIKRYAIYVIIVDDWQCNVDRNKNKGR